ncbi:archaetidylserine decarboxylase [Oleiagrimonas sp. C23AA]|uniref:archaetidylserine decarboxylase n=1 Tax=Oleiagrimonas sp. C23AA TaxID=2719047 RepID=UPI00142071AD|nr:archaetidylserine decarboxylase [Oleiagrimonas sp. C23AA]NII10118.1 phosphatidylserine decarboxylase [Oleiagrimonas sp. C23AA]
MKAKVALQYILPHRACSRVVYWATRWRFGPWKHWLISQIVRRYDVDMSQAAEPDIRSYPTFNAFFTRALKAGARAPAGDADTLLCPADGKISQTGRIENGRIFQAKGQSYSAAELLGSEEAAAPYRNGHFATIYLSPRDYHRVHMPADGALTATTHIPGRIFSVAPFAVEAIPRLFARNERLVCHFENQHGPFALVLVGAILVSSISTVWDGLVVPPYASNITAREQRARNIRLARFEEMGRFNMGSTVIVLLPEGASVDATLTPLAPVKMGQRLGQWNATHPS